jgi:hypothetical protein
MITTTTKHTVNVTESELFLNLSKRFLDILDDNIPDHELFTIEACRLSDLLLTIEKSGWSSIFNDGYTAVVLSNEDMEYIEDFAKGKKGDGVLEVVIKRRNGSVQIIPWDLVQY